MTPQDFERVRELFLAARELDAAKRSEYLGQACTNDPDVRAEVEALLAQEDEGNDLLNVPSRAAGLRSGLERVLQTAECEPVPERIGRYSILGTLGEGGMGTVYLAEQEHPRRKVALKVVRPSGISHQLLRRFEHEASILGQLAHPGIAHIHEAGIADVQTKSGLAGKWPFFAMEYVRGEPLGQYVEHREPSVPQRLALLASICDAVHHAHQKGVIHRDLKPGNILVDEQGQAKILDFGVARLTDADIQTVTMLTEAGQLIGTVPYMSPEQVTGATANIDTRSDVYALGVICYELLAGSLPYNLQDRSIPEAARIIREEEPTRLSSVDASLRGDLDTIVGKALEKDKTRRYQSASELAADIRNYLNDRPIAARPPTTFYQLRMFAHRNKALVGGLLATFVALVIGIAGIAVQATRIARERSHAEQAEQLADRRRELAELRAYAANIAAAHAALRANDVLTCRQRLEAASPLLRNWEWRYLANHLDASLGTFEGHEHYVWAVAYGPDGSWLASSSADGTVKLRDATTGRVLRTLNPRGGGIRGVAVSPDGQRLVTAADRGSPQVWSSATGEELMSLAGHTGGITNASFSPNGALIASASYDGTARVWDAGTGTLQATFTHPNWVHDVCFTPDSTRLATSCRDNVARLWDVSMRTPVVEVEVLPSTAEWDFVHSWGVTIDPDGRILATGAHDGVIRLWSTETGGFLESLSGHTQRVRALAFSPDGTRLASASDDGTVRIWDPVTGLELATLLGHERSVFGVAFSPDAARLASAAADHTVRIWDGRVTPQLGRIWGHDNRGVRTLDVSRDGARIVSGGEDSVVGLWDIQSGDQVAAMRGHEGWVWAVEFSPDGRHAISGSDDGTVRLWDLEAGVQEAVVGRHDGVVRAVTYVGSGTRVASASMDGTLKIWDLAGRCELMTMTGESDQYTALACSPDGNQLASGAHTGRIDFWDVQTARRLSTTETHAGLVWHVAYSPDGSRVVSASNDMTLKLWSPRTGELVATLRGHTGDVSSAAFSPDGTRIASVSFDQTLRLWDLVTCETVLSFRAHHGWPFAVAFSPDGAWLVSSGRSMRIWRTTGPAR